MKQYIAQLSKYSLFSAILVSCTVSYLSNMIFNSTGGVFFDDSLVSNTNNVLSSIQLVGYLTIQLINRRRLTCFDSPFILGGLISIIF